MDATTGVKPDGGDGDIADAARTDSREGPRPDAGDEPPVADGSGIADRPEPDDDAGSTDEPPTPVYTTEANLDASNGYRQDGIAAGLIRVTWDPFNIPVELGDGGVEVPARYYRVYRSTYTVYNESVPLQLVCDHVDDTRETDPGGRLLFEDTEVVNGTQYFYRVQGFYQDPELGEVSGPLSRLAEGHAGVYWEKVYNGVDPTFEVLLRNESFEIALSADGGYAVVGLSLGENRGGEQAFALELDENGEVSWALDFGGDQRDEGATICPTRDGGFIMGVLTSSYGEYSADENMFNVLPVKLTAGGLVEPGWDPDGWAGDLPTVQSRVYSTEYFDQAAKVRETLDREKAGTTTGYILAGHAYADNPGAAINPTRGFAVRVDVEGNITDQYLFGDPTDGKRDELWDIKQVFDDQGDPAGFIAAGTRTLPANDDHDIFVQRLDDDLDPLWGEYGKMYGGSSYDIAYGIELIHDGQGAHIGYVVAGATASAGFCGDGDLNPVANDVFILKLDLDGNIMAGDGSVAVYDHGEQENVAFDIEKTSDGGYVLAGTTGHRNELVNDLLFGLYYEVTADLYLLKVDASLAREWERTYGSQVFSDNGFSVKQTSDGGYVVNGSTDRMMEVSGSRTDAYNREALVLRLDPDGLL